VNDEKSENRKNLIDCWKVDKALIERVAKVSHIELNDDELEKFSKQMESILEAFRALDEVDTEKVEPSFHPQELKNMWREDEVEEWDWRNSSPLDNTTHKEGRYFKGPKTV